MRRPSLRSQLNQIRLWVRQGRTDAWIAHKLDISVGQLEQFKRDHGLTPGAEPEPVRAAPEPPASVDEAPPPEDRDDEDEPAPARRRRRGPPASVDEAPPPEDREDEPAPARRRRRGPPARADEASPPEDREDGPEPARRRRRGRRGGRRRGAKRSASFEATFDHGEDGYGLWLDPAVAENPIYTEHWAGHREIAVVVEADAITIRRAGGAGEQPVEEEPERRPKRAVDDEYEFDDDF